MPTEQMFWGEKTYDGGATRVPLAAYRCKSHLVKTVDGVTKATGHKCKKVVDHDGDHGCICLKTWAQNTGKPS